MIQKKCYHVDDINKRYYVHEIDCEDVIYQTNENWTTLMKLSSLNEIDHIDIIGHMDENILYGC